MTRGPEIWPITFASTPKCASVCTSRSAIRAAVSADAASFTGEARRTSRSGSLYSACSTVMSSKSVGGSSTSCACCAVNGAGSVLNIGASAYGTAGSSPTTSGYASSASTIGFFERFAGAAAIRR